jgi:hypothetical protein
MAWIALQVTIRCSNQSSYSSTPYEEIVLDCLAAKPRWKDEPDTEPTRDVSGYMSNSIARRREYELIVRDASVSEDSNDGWDYGAIDYRLRFLYAKKLWLVSVAGSPRVWRGATNEIDPAASYWDDGNGITYPQEVRRVSFDYGDGENGSLSPVLVLEDVEPVVGVAIT